MSISYEEALATLQAMFGDPWTREALDAVLRHEKGHMENTCELILQHGDNDPQILVERLKSGGPEPQVAMDEQLARQLAAQSSSAGRGGTNLRGRGTPTRLPNDFLRLPGYKPTASAAAGATPAAAMDDETLARMLQDELFSEELARNPDFAHLARGGRRTTASNARMPAGRRTAGGGTAPPQNPFEGVNLMQKVSDMGEGARRRLQQFAINFEQKMNNIGSGGGGAGPNTGVSGPQRGSLQEASGAAAERRGLLDDDDGEDMIEFETRKKSD
ncbi:CUE domain containing protein [Nitzschia inconspicua]|uniref:CUE domain containing protein n=1 Tax=Nitzschia inconspicua TaxID=303405 RepID=A0A9K3LT02_9STRA|nr:CUE domain containing protein [Nitzschia inconspicua]